jgi:glutathione S-transferase
MTGRDGTDDRHRGDTFEIPLSGVPKVAIVVAGPRSLPETGDAGIGSIDPTRGADMVLRIYGVLRSRATRTVWLAKELGIPYELVPVIQAARLAAPALPEVHGHTASTSFRSLNPNGLIPCIDDDGFILNESLAINLYLAKKHRGPLAPSNFHEDGLMTMWAIWVAGECEPHAVQVLLNRSGRPAGQRDPALADAAIAALKRPFGVLEQALRSGEGYVVGRRFTVADINLAEVLRYAQPAPELFAEFPAVRAWIEACQARAAFREMMAEREVEPA